MSNRLYGAALPFKGLSGTQAIFGGTPVNATWGEPENRPVAAGELTIDKRFWELLGEPDVLCVGFATEEGWKRFVGDPPVAKVLWMQAQGSEASDAQD